MSPPSIPESRVRGSGCPLCGKPPAAAFRPFCSKGCRDRDLLAWFGEGYRLPGRPIDSEDAESGGSGLDSDADTPL